MYLLRKVNDVKILGCGKMFFNKYCAQFWLFLNVLQVLLILARYIKTVYTSTHSGRP